MDRNYETFDAAHVGLQPGIHLVEASAGTGKTYAIGMLVLRALVEQQVPIEKILIVTFTKAATEELRSRIRRRLIDARDLLLHTSGGDSQQTDATLLSWAAGLRGKRQGLLLLQQAIANIDLAGIFTIHGFCQRMLADQALESGQMFDVELIADIGHVRRQVAEDFWRRRIYPLDPLPCSLVTGPYPTPEQLLASVLASLTESCVIEPPLEPVDGLVKHLEMLMGRLRTWWVTARSELIDRCEDGATSNMFNKKFREGYETWIADLDLFFTGSNNPIPENIHWLERQSLAGELNGTRLKGQQKKDDYLADWPLADEDIGTFLRVSSQLVLMIRRELADELRKEVKMRLARQGTLGFDDLISNLASGLQGEGGQQLQKNLATRFSVALIDEFQDTDTDQWYIFSTLFGSSTHSLYLIGDPKQAIYRFRGADINAYFHAKKSAVRWLTLDHNYRSHPALVAEINNRFGARPRPFLVDENILAYRSVTAALSTDELALLQAGSDRSGMVYCQLPPDSSSANGQWGSSKAAAVFCQYTVNEILRLLDPLEAATLRGKEERPLAPQDIAILVRSNTQLETYRQALAAARIPVVVASRRSVFQTAECRELVLLLQAIFSPGDLGQLLGALSISWFGLSGNDLQRISRDEDEVVGFHTRFLRYNRLWQDEGILSMMSRLLEDERVLVTLAASPRAERAIANIYHLLELAQEKQADEKLRCAEVMAWLKKMMVDGGRSENSELLLESDAEAVRIITMHGAKGLEYPVVFCPYLWYHNDFAGNEKEQVKCYENSGQVVDLGSESFEERRQRVMAEEQAENLRLLYVALTRAKLRCYTMWADVKKQGALASSFESALGYLLFAKGKCSHEEQKNYFTQLTGTSGVTYHEVAVDQPVGEYRVKPTRNMLQAEPGSGRSLQTDWQVSSFSALSTLSEYALEATPDTVDAVVQEKVAVPGLPAGPHFGNLVHDLLERLDFAAIGNGDGYDDILTQLCHRYGIVADEDQLQKLMQLVVSTQLLPPSIANGRNNFCLAALSSRKCLKEMEFYLHLDLLTTDTINSILSSEPACTPLAYKSMRGYLTGFIDLVCEHDGKFYILDYKTNFLGDYRHDYAHEQLQAAMQSHNYGLQYWIYTLVLHRYLSRVIPRYDHHHHFGGILYLFVRGMSPALPGSGVYFARPSYEKLIQLDAAVGKRDRG